MLGRLRTDKNKNIYCRKQGNTKLYKLKNYKPIYKHKYFSGNINIYIKKAFGGKKLAPNGSISGNVAPQMVA